MIHLTKRLSLFHHRCNADAREVLADTLARCGLGIVSVRDLCRYSPYWPMQVGAALARLLWLGKIERVEEGRYRRIA